MTGRSTSGAPTTTATCSGCGPPIEALGGDPDTLEMLIMQLVHLMQSGERAQMSKRPASS